MNSFDLSIRGKTFHYSGPSCWQELTPRQAVVLIRFRERINQDLSILFPVLELLYGIRLSQQKWLFDERFLKRKKLAGTDRYRALSQGQALIDTLNWIGQTEPDADFLVNSFRLYDFQYGSARVLSVRLLHPTRYHGPASGLENCTVGEFMYAEQAFLAGDLAQLAAILYRPARWWNRDEDVRRPFRVSQVDRRAARFRRLDPALLSLIYLHYAACQRELHRCFPNVFVKKDEIQASQPAKNPSATWLDVVINMAGLDVTKVGQIEKTNLYLTLKVLDEKIRQADELEEQMDALKTKK